MAREVHADIRYIDVSLGSESPHYPREQLGRDRPVIHAFRETIRRGALAREIGEHQKIFQTKCPNKATSSKTPTPHTQNKKLAVSFEELISFLSIVRV